MNKHLLFKLLGSLTLMTMDQFHNAVREAKHETGLSRIVLDLAGLEFLDSNGIGALVTVQKNAASEQGCLHLVNVSPRIKETLRITRLDKLIPVFNSVAAATQLPGDG